MFRTAAILAIICALASACAAQTALRGDLGPNHRVVTNEQDLAALAALDLLVADVEDSLIWGRTKLYGTNNHYLAASLPTSGLFTVWAATKPPSAFPTLRYLPSLDEWLAAATTQQLAEAVAPLATTQQIAEIEGVIEDVAEFADSKVSMQDGVASNLFMTGDTYIQDSYTNVVWRSVISNGWHWLAAFTNAWGGEE